MISKYLNLFIITISLFVASCSSNTREGNLPTTDSTSDMMKMDIPEKGDNKGIGKFKDVQLSHPLDEKMIAAGKSIFETKCFACHKLTDEKLVGPGWKGVTDRRTSEWIMNFITNTNVMLDSDLVAQKMFITCLVRMPSQGVTDSEARDMLEFMRMNDGKK